MSDQPKQAIPPPRIHYRLGLIVAAVLIIVIAVLLLIFGKLIIGGILALLGAVFGLGAQVISDDAL